jgi:hypothetical protein
MRVLLTHSSSPSLSLSLSLPPAISHILRECARTHARACGARVHMHVHLHQTELQRSRRRRQHSMRREDGRNGRAADLVGPSQVNVVRAQHATAKEKQVRHPDGRCSRSCLLPIARVRASTCVCGVCSMPLSLLRHTHPQIQKRSPRALVRVPPPPLPPRVRQTWAHDRKMRTRGSSHLARRRLAARRRRQFAGHRSTKRRNQEGTGCS